MRSVRALLPRPLHASLRAAYLTVSGRRSRAITDWRLRRSVREPRTYQEKVRRKVAFDRDPILRTMVDKVAVRDLVAGAVGPDILTVVHAIGTDPSEVDWSALPREFACKVSHGCGGVVLVWDGADPAARLPEDPRGHDWGRLEVRPEHLDLPRLQRLLGHWLTLDYAWWPGKRTPEWAYAGVRPRILVEELLRDPDGGLPSDYKLHVIHGRVAFVRVMANRSAGSYTATTFDRDWQPLPVRFVGGGATVAPTDPVPTAPDRGAALVAVAEALGSLTDSMRVDLYCLGPRIVFGELTPYPSAGEGAYHPPTFEVGVGDLWRQAY